MIEKLGITPGPTSWITTGADNVYLITNTKRYRDTTWNAIIETPYFPDVRIYAAAPDMLEALIDHAIANEKEWGCQWAVAIIEKATGRTWEEVKQSLEASNADEVCVL